jgi:hypothetical protein
MHPGVHAHFARQHGLVSREQLLDLGLTPLIIRSMVDGEELVRVRRGVYVDPVVWAAADGFRERPLLRARAAIMRMRRGWVLSHASAAHLLGLDIVPPDEPLVEVTRPGITNAWTKSGVRHHLARFLPEQVVERTGLRALDLARTAVDIARDSGDLHGLAACDSALRMGCARADLWDAVAMMTHWPGVVGARTSIELADARAQTVIESLGRHLVLELDIGQPDLQFPVLTRRGVAWCDIRVGNHIFETDGRLKYRGVDRGGVADRPGDEVLMDEKRRQTEVAAEGLGVSRLVWEDFWGSHRAEARHRLRAEYDVTVRRFGTQLPSHLAFNAEQIRGQRRA